MLQLASTVSGLMQRNSNSLAHASASAPYTCAREPASLQSTYGTAPSLELNTYLHIVSV